MSVCRYARARRLGGAALLGMTCAALPLAACSAPGAGGSTALTIQSRDRDTWMTPAYRTAVYRAVDENTADIFLSDVPEESLVERLRAGAAGPPATITHIRLFLNPKAGKTPIDFTASNTTITHVVMSGQATGVYGGGGFLLPSQSIGAEQFGGKIKDASLRLLRSDEGFADLLGLAEMSGALSAKRDDTFADTISARLVLLLRR